MKYQPVSGPPYGFREGEWFPRDRARIVAQGVSAQEFDAHLFAIQDAIGPDPFAEPWSAPVPNNPLGLRSAVSDATPAEPNALLILFRVEGDLIKLERVRKRDG